MYIDALLPYIIYVFAQSGINGRHVHCVFAAKGEINGCHVHVHCVFAAKGWVNGLIMRILLAALRSS